MMKAKYRVNSFHFVVAVITSLLSGLALCYTLPREDYLATVIYFAVFLIFACVAAKEGATVTVSPSGVEMKCLGKCLRSYSWEEIAEAGIAGTDVFNRGKKKKKWNKYFYFSKSSMTDEERFKMCLEWPPKDKIFFRFDYDRVGVVQMNWNKELQFYNANDIVL